ncbi:MAG: heparinase II/III family protein [Chlorobi bacterium]|nr:heparinase II/III family protein [Chlorobiota bacterium]
MVSELRRYQLRMLPLGIILRKAIRRTFRTTTRSRRHSSSIQPYTTPLQLPWETDAPLAQHLDIPPVESFARYADTAHAISMHCRSGRWFVLGCGWIEPLHGFTAPGINGNRYDTSPLDAEQIAHGYWLEKRLPHSAVPRAQWLWNMIEGPHRPIDWQRDFRSGYRWNESTPHHRIAFDPAPGVDPKVPWELGRLQLLPLLALEAHHTGDATYRAELANVIETTLLDFAAQNPPGYGIQWASPMDVAIRLANILVTLDLVRSVGFRQSATESITLYAYDHAQFVLSNLEWSEGMRGNHYLACIAGLSVAASYFPNCQWTRHLRRWCAEQLCREIDHQFLPDGGNFEASVAYHRLAAEMLAWAVWFLRRTPEGCAVFDREWTPISHLATIAAFTNEVTYRSWIAPQIGDNDSGRFLQLIPFSDVGLATGKLCGRSDPYLSQRSHRETCILTCAVAANRRDIVTALYEDSAYQRRQQFSAPHFGVAVQRNQRWEVFLRAGSIGQRGKGGHAHNDQLSVTLAFDGNEILVDAGTGVYLASPEIRNRFRSTRMHNTLAFNSIEQNTWSDATSEALFWLTSDRAHARLISCDSSTIIAEHFAYGFPHRRIIQINNEGIIIHDYFASPNQAVLYFHIHPLLAVVLTTDGACLSSNHWSIICTAQRGRIDIAESSYSHSYGAQTPSKAIIVHPATDVTHTEFRLVTGA